MIPEGRDIAVHGTSFGVAILLLSVLQTHLVNPARTSKWACKHTFVLPESTATCGRCRKFRRDFAETAILAVFVRRVADFGRILVVTLWLLRHMRRSRRLTALRQDRAGGFSL